MHRPDGWRPIARLLPRGFNQQVAILSALSLLISLAVFGYVIYRKQTALQEEAAIAQANIVIRNYATAAYRDILQANHDNLRDLMLKTAEFPEVRRIVVTDNQGRVINDVTHRPGEEPMLALHTPDMRPPPRSDGSDTTNASATRREGNIYELWIPIADQGWVFMQYDYSAQSERYLAVFALKSVPACYLPFFQRFTFLAYCIFPSGNYAA
jgi:hypothetical protein